MRLQELFKNTNTTWKWTFRGSEEAEAKFAAGDVQYVFYAFSHSKYPTEWEVEFRAVDGVQSGKRFGITGTGNSVQVMSTVIDILRDFLNHYKDKVTSLTFTAKENSRRDLYARMVRRLLPTWKFTLTGDRFILTSMNDVEPLKETTEEDRALISLSSAIYKKLQEYAYGIDEYTDDYNESFTVGKIGDLFDTPIPALNDVKVSIQSDNKMFKRAKLASVDVTRDPYKEFISGLWDAGSNEIVFNEDHLNSNNMKATVTHELRHALDDMKSDYRAGDSKHYFSASNKFKYDPEAEDTAPPIPQSEYTAQKGEINARFAEVMHGMILAIRRAYVLPPDKIKSHIMKEFKVNLQKKRISDLFPEKERSPQYRRLINRALDMFQKEMSHIEAELTKQGRPKKATGSF